mmetsp:Transcript_122026/g.356495  ORF Transcript_122026/g.356495 Transcript_122026/m.356495 type:complete len:218 (+) Transcript_122026:386-1039(+)
MTPPRSSVNARRGGRARDALPAKCSVELGLLDGGPTAHAAPGPSLDVSPPLLPHLVLRPRVRPHWCDAELLRHLHELVETDLAVAVDVEATKELEHAVFVKLVVAAELPRGVQGLLLLRHIVEPGGRHLSGGEPHMQVLGNRVHELLRRQSARTRHVSRASAFSEGTKHRLATGQGEAAGGLGGSVVVGGLQGGRMVHGTEKGNDHSQWIHGRLFAT